MSTVTKRVTTVNLEGSVKEVVFDREYPYFEVANMGSDPVYLSKYEDILAGTDGVYTILAGSSIVARMDSDTVYVSGSGVVQIAAKYEAEHSFKSTPKGGEGGGGSAKAVIDDRRAVADVIDRGWTITERGNSSKNSDFDILCYKVSPGSMVYIVAEDDTLPCKFVWQDDSNVREIDPNPNLVAPPVLTAYRGVLTVPDRATWICFSVQKNDGVTGLYVMQQVVDISGELIVDTELSDTSPRPIANKTVANALFGDNLLINPDLAIDQRGVSGTVSAISGQRTYFVDRWSIDSGSVTIGADGTITLNGTMSQIIEDSIGDSFTASCDGGSCSYDDASRKFTVTANGSVIKWAKLERGSTATAFVPPDPATELLKCQRYYVTFGQYARFPMVWQNGIVIDFKIVLPVPLRISPKSNIDQVAVVSGGGGYFPDLGFSISPTALNFDRYNGNWMDYRATKSNHGLTSAYMTVPEANKLYFDAEIY